MSAEPNRDFEFAALSEARNYRAALAAEFGPFIGGRVLEIGAGIGQMTAAIASQPNVTELLAVEPERKFVDHFQERSAKVSLLHGTAQTVQSKEWNAIVS